MELVRLTICGKYSREEALRFANFGEGIGGKYWKISSLPASACPLDCVHGHRPNAIHFEMEEA